MRHFEEFIINTEIGEVFKKGQCTYDVKEATGVLLPLYFQFQRFFEKDDNLSKALNGTEQSGFGFQNNFIKTNTWQRKVCQNSFVDKVVLPFFLYMDDVEINNPLGSHCGPTTFFYYSFPTVKNCDIFLAMVIKGVDYKQYKNEKCLSRLVEELKLLEENGIDIKTGDGVKTVHFALAIIIGDNLAMNLLLGFAASFNQNVYCRFCKCDKATCHKLSTSIETCLRNKENYSLDLQTNDVSQTGVKENCIFNSLNSFHVTSNYSVDVMHDVFEGVCHYNMCHIIKYFLSEKYFTLDILNARKDMFNYGELEVENVSPRIYLQNLNKFHLKMSAREMMTFVHLFPLMIGDLIPEDDDVWIFFFAIS